MPSAPAALWLEQAQSDLAAGQLVFDIEHSHNYCHSVAKYQQATEKAIKAMVAGLAEAGVLREGPSFSHDLRREWNTLKRIPRSRDIRDVFNLVASVTDSNNWSGINDLCSLAPRRVVPPDLAPRNPEYPYQLPNGGWTIPARSQSFSEPEMNRFERIASRTCGQSHEVLSFLHRYPR